MNRAFGPQKQLNLILYKVYAEVKAEALRSYLGILWWLIEPVLYLGTFYILFVLVLERGNVDFIPDFLCGIVVWKLFDAGVKIGGNALAVNKSLLQQVYVPKYIFPLSSVIGALLRFIPVFIVLCLVIFIYTGEIGSIWLWSIPLIMLQILLVFSLAALVSSVVPFIPDLKVAIDNAMMFLFFVSGVLFDIASIGEPLKSLLMINPMAIMIAAYRDVLLVNKMPDLGALAVVLVFSLFCLLVGIFILNRLDRKYAKARF